MVTIFKWILIASALGIMEGFMYHLKDVSKSVGKDSFILKHINRWNFGLWKPSEHDVFTLVRAVIFLCLVPWSSTFSFFILATSCMLLFPFFHDGFYYMTRHQLNKAIYPRQFLDTSDGSGTNNLQLDFIDRSMMLIASVLVALFL